jgi:malate dehydrogenase
VSDGSYGVPEGLVAGFPVVSHDGRYEVVPGLEIDEFGRQRIDRSVAELLEERDLVMASGLVPAAGVGAGRSSASAGGDRSGDRTHG